MLTTTLLLNSQLLDQPSLTNTPLPTQTGAADNDHDVHYWLGNPGRCTGVKRAFIFGFDDSGSVMGIGGNDPHSKRYAEARLAIRRLARACSCGQEVAAVSHWDASTLDVPPTPLSRSGIARIQAGLRQPRDANGTSDLGPVLRRIAKTADTLSRRGSVVDVIIASDFAITDPDADTVFIRLDRLAKRHHVTAAVLGEYADPRLIDNHINVVPIAATDPPGALAKALFDRLTDGRPGRRPANPATTTTTTTTTTPGPGLSGGWL